MVRFCVACALLYKGLREARIERALELRCIVENVERLRIHEIEIDPFSERPSQEGARVGLEAP